MTKLNTNRYNCIMVMPVFLLKFRVKNKLAPASSLLFSLVLIDSLERVTSLSSHCLQCSFHCAHSLCSPAYFRPPFACSQTRSCEFASLKFVLILSLERVTRIELALKAWEALVLPLNYTRTEWVIYYIT